MKNIRRSRRLRLPRRRHQLTNPITSDEDDESDRQQHHKSILRTNQNANRMTPTLLDTNSMNPIEENPYKPLHRSSDQSSLFLYSINSIQKPAVSSDDLTPLTSTTTNTTPLTALSFSNTKQTEIGTVKIDLTDLSDSDHEQSSLSLDRIENLDHKPKTMEDQSIQSVTFPKENSFEQEQSYYQQASCFTIPDIGNGDCTTPLPTDIDIKQSMTNKMKLLIGCSSLGLIAGLLILVIVL